MGLVAAWYRKSSWLLLLWPLSILYRVLTARRRARLEARPKPEDLPPVVIIGNITLGGTGKTPLLIQLARNLLAQGVRVGIVSRGYGGNPKTLPCEVSALSTTEEVGDEAVLIRRSVECPIIIDPKRPRAVRALAQRHGCELILSDDGLQHYAMARAMELVVLDGTRMFGNGLCLPAGPLREPVQRLLEVDQVLVNGGSPRQWQPELEGMALRAPVQAMSVRPGRWVNIATGERVALDELPLEEGAPLHAIAGIGNPHRFFATVRELGYAPLCHPFPDHYRFSAQELAFAGDDVVVMTQKDAVKCERFAGPNTWYLEIEAQLDANFLAQLCDDIRQLTAPRAAKETHEESV